MDGHRYTIGGNLNEEGQWSWNNGKTDTLEYGSGYWSSDNPNGTGKCLYFRYSAQIGYDDARCIGALTASVCELSP